MSQNGRYSIDDDEEPITEPDPVARRFDRVEARIDACIGDIRALTLEHRETRQSVNRALGNITEGIGRLTAEVARLSHRVVRAETQAEIAVDRSGSHPAINISLAEHQSKSDPPMPRPIKQWIKRHRTLVAIFTFVITTAAAIFSAWQAANL